MKQQLSFDESSLKSWQIGDRIGGIFEIREIIGGQGKTGMGIVYICYYKWHQKLYAVKTVQDQFLSNPNILDDFYNEAILWMELGKHPNIVQANWVHRFDGHIYIVMDFIHRDNYGRLSLTDHLSFYNKFTLIRTLIWALQFCDGMIHANSFGLKVHRDVKPDNILITLSKTLKISDFGLARAYKNTKQESGIAGSLQWMSPEQFYDGEECTPQSDIYSFGIVLYQMASGRLPFNSTSKGSEFIEEMKKLHEKANVPELVHPLFPIIQKSLSKKPENRFLNFHDLRVELSLVWRKSTKLPVPSVSTNPILSFKEVNQKGVALYQLGKSKEALFYHDQAIQMDPTYPNAWNDKGNALKDIGLLDDAVFCYEHAIEIDAEFVHPVVNKAALVSDRGDLEESILLYDKAIEIDNEFINAWTGKAFNLLKLGKYIESVNCCEKALEITRKDSYIWYLKAIALYYLYKTEIADKNILSEAIQSVNNSLLIDPNFSAASDLYNILNNLTI